jgi:hypothetical protein
VFVDLAALSSLVIVSVFAVELNVVSLVLFREEPQETDSDEARNVDEGAAAPRSSAITAFGWGELRDEGGEDRGDGPVADRFAAMTGSSIRRRPRRGNAR